MGKLTNITMLFILSCALVYCQSKTGAMDAQAPVTQTTKTTHASNVLLQFNIITEDEIARDEFITNYEALDVIRRITSGEYNAYHDLLKDWYAGDSLESLDYLDDDYKRLLMVSRENLILDRDEFYEIKPDENITSLNSLIFINRMVKDTYGCVRVLDGADKKDKSENYQIAFEKGIIDNRNTEDADSFIRREDFYGLIYRAVNVEKSFGGYAPTTAKYIDMLEKRAEYPRKPRESVTLGRHELFVDYRIDDDLSISWVMPPEYHFLSGEQLSVNLELKTKDGLDVKGWGLMASFESFSDGIEGQRIAHALVSAYPERPIFLRVTCTRYDDNYNKKEEWYFNIDLSSIDVAIKGDKIEPGVFTHFRRQWVPKSMTLKDGRKFKAGALYFLKSYEHRYRKPEYNSTNMAVFAVSEDTDIINNGDHSLNLHSGGIYPEDIHIQEIVVGSNPNGGLKLFVTPESKGSFTVVEASE